MIKKKYFEYRLRICRDIHITRFVSDLTYIGNYLLPMIPTSEPGHAQSPLAQRFCAGAKLIPSRENSHTRKRLVLHIVKRSDTYLLCIVPFTSINISLRNVFLNLVNTSYDRPFAHYKGKLYTLSRMNILMGQSHDIYCMNCVLICR